VRATVHKLICLLFSITMIASLTFAATGAIPRGTTSSAKDYNSINAGTHPITNALIYPNDTAWKHPRVECLIITAQALAPSFQPLAELKTRRGTFTEILTVESIYANSTFTAGGGDNPTYIRNAIKYYHDNEGTEFIILGGDVNVIPIRYTYNTDYTEAYFPGSYATTYKPTDQYYAGLEGTWDEDDDGKYGEQNRYNTENIDEVDWTAEVFVGRLPANDATQAQVLVQKIIDYETNPPNGTWYNKGIFGGAVSQYQDLGLNKPSVDEAALSEFMIDSYFNSMQANRIYHCSSTYTCPSNYTQLNTANLAAAWDQGAAIVNLAGHGDPSAFGGYIGTSSFSNYLTRTGAATLVNNGTLPFVYIFSCSSGAFDIREIGSSPMNLGDSLAEALLLNQYAGAIGVVSAMRTTYFFEDDTQFEALNHGQDRFFWREMMINHEYQPGRTLYLSKMSYIDQFINKYWNVDLNYDPELAEREGYMVYQENFRKNLLTYNLLGDPEISIYTGIPGTFASDITSQTAYIGDTMDLEMRSMTDDLVSGARVLLNGSGYYIVGQANELGMVTLPVPLDQALVGTNMTITLSGHNMKTTSKNVTIAKDTIAPTMLQVDIPASIVDYRGTFTVNASGIDAGSGLRYAFVVFVDEMEAPLTIHRMDIKSVSGNQTIFYFKFPDILPPGQTLLFYVVAFDASGNYVIARPTELFSYAVQVSSRIMEDALTATIIIGVPAFAIIITVFFMVSRKTHQKRSAQQLHEMDYRGDPNIFKK